MEELDYWRLCDELTVVQAALLLAGIAPSGEFHYVMNWDEHKRPENFSATLAALSHAVLGGRLPAKLTTFHDSRWDEATQTHIVTYDSGIPDWDNTTILIDDLKTWLISRGIKSDFFFPQSSDTCVNEPPGYLDPNHPHYAPKLAAAIAAWHAVDTYPELARKKSAKQAMKEWLKENAKQLGIIKKGADAPSEKSVEEIAVVSNWDGDGGAPKTQG